MIVVLVEKDLAGDAVEVSRETMTFARDLAEAGGGVPVDAVVVGDVPTRSSAPLASYGVRRRPRPHRRRRSTPSPGPPGPPACATVRRAARSVVVTAAGTPRGDEVLAHVAARAGVPMAANVVSFGGLSPFMVTRQVVGGAALEEMQLGRAPDRLHGGRPRGRGHARRHAPVRRAGRGRPPTWPTPTCSPGWCRPRSPPPTSPAASKSARVVVGAGRGAGRRAGFDDLLELAELLDGSLGVSRVVTSLGWRPHHEQVGQTGSRISPDLYIPCGISGAIQHWAGCSSAKAILAINTDPDAPMVTKATHAVIGDLHEVVPAINAEIRRRRAG